MKKIIKKNSPDWFETWKDDFQRNNRRKPTYKDDFAINDNERIRLRKELIKEQGEICCYCMKRIDASSSHTEHFWPKSKFEDIDLEYNNLFASCNGLGIVGEEGYCGHKKDDWFISGMISPLDARIEDLFKFSPDGEIHIIQGNALSNIAKEMKDNLGLDCYHLNRNRRQAIEESEYLDETEYTPEEIQTFIDYYANMDNGKYMPYCKAIIDCLKTLL